MKSAIVCILGCLLVLLCVSSINAGGCLTDSDTSHVASDYNTRLYSYTSKRPAQPSTKSALKFMTYNVQSGFFFNCTNSVVDQAAFLAQADYVGNQETVQNVDTRCSSCNMGQLLADGAGMSTRFGMAMPWRTGQYGDTVGTSQTILDTQYIVIPYTCYETRIAVAIKTQPAALNGRALWYVNIHIEYYLLAVRQFQIAQILAWVNSNILAADPQAVIVMGGDFNGGPWDPVYATMKSFSYQDAWEVFHGSINDGNTIPADWPGSRFDHIWFRVPYGVSVTVVDASVPNVLMSDHRPFTCTLNFGGQPPASATQKPVVTVAPTQKPVVTVAPTQKPVVTVAPTQKPVVTPAPPTGNACTDAQRGFMRCSGSYYQTCDHGAWQPLVACAGGLICHPSGNYVYCGYA